MRRIMSFNQFRHLYDLRRLRLHGLLERLPHSHRYQVTPEGRRICLFLTKVHARVLRPGLAQLIEASPECPNRSLACAMRGLDTAVDHLVQEAKLAA